jgi:hypothetical protein
MNRRPTREISRRDALRLLGERATAVALGSHTLRWPAGGPGSRPQQTTLLIRGGTVVNADGARRADVVVVNDRVTQIAASIPMTRGMEVIDATGKLVISRWYRSPYAPAAGVRR